MGFLEELTQYVWNNWVFVYAFNGLTYAWWAGGLGVIFDDDDGYMTNMLYKVLGGMNVKFPI